MTTDLLPAIHGRLARFGCCEGYTNPGLDQARAAVAAALGCHPAIPYGIVDGQVTSVCNKCNEPWPCMEVRLIARALGVEVKDG
jgi:hypothetical protein